VQRRHHYELAFEHHLRERRVPYVAVDEARKALLPAGTIWGASLKSFDFVLYGEGLNLLAEVKGRRIGGRGLDSWATQEDVDALTGWERLFGDGFAGALVFVYWCESQPPAPLFEEVFEFKGRWYAIRAALARDYAPIMKPRSVRWRTVHVPGPGFDRISRPLGAALAGPAAAPLYSGGAVVA
jgi:hypothetical protein